MADEKVHIEEKGHDDFASVLVQAVITNYHRLGDLNNKCLFLTILKARGLRSGCQQSSGEDPLPGSQMAVLSLCPHMVESRERGSKLSHVSSYKGTDPIMTASLS